ncbi:MAG: molecular chaperone TorD family protein [Deltaproteobacteria bacterium]|nr:molecular chaperone TorD family protein [Deltaproteobacteria bacterium]
MKNKPDLNPEKGAVRQVRRFFYELGKSFFVAEPDEAKVAGWRQVCCSLAGEIPDPAVAGSVRRLAGLLEDLELQRIQEEYYDLFVNPFSVRQVNWTASYYLDGHHFGRRLVEVRQLMAASGYVKEEEYKEPEDSLPVLLDLMVRMIETENAENEVATQERLRRDFLEPVVAGISQRLQQLEGVEFYSACAEFLQSWLRMEDNCLG